MQNDGERTGWTCPPLFGRREQSKDYLSIHRTCTKSTLTLYLSGLKKHLSLGSVPPPGPPMKSRLHYDLKTSRGQIFEPCKKTTVTRIRGGLETLLEAIRTWYSVLVTRDLVASPKQALIRPQCCLSRSRLTREHEARRRREIQFRRLRLGDTW